jgi:hypothetical protein
MQERRNYQTANVHLSCVQLNKNKIWWRTQWEQKMIQKRDMKVSHIHNIREWTIILV